MNNRLQGPRFLALGALAQAPNMTMKDTLFNKYVAEEIRAARPDSMLYGLVRARFASHNHMRGTVTLTELGGEQLRVPGAPRCPRFLRVPESYLQ